MYKALKQNIPSHPYQMPTTTTTCKNSDTSSSDTNTTILEISKMVKEIREELKHLRCEVNELKNKEDIEAEGEQQRQKFTSIKIPVTYEHEFEALEAEVSSDENKQRLLAIHFKGLCDFACEKYIRCCLKSVLSDEAACQFSWYGQHENIPVKNYTIMQILKDVTQSKFPSATVIDIENVIKKWFHYSKDRMRKLSARR